MVLGELFDEPLHGVGRDYDGLVALGEVLLPEVLGGIREQAPHVLAVGIGGTQAHQVQHRGGVCIRIETAPFVHVEQHGRYHVPAVCIFGVCLGAGAVVVEHSAALQDHLCRGLPDQPDLPQVPHDIEIVVHRFYEVVPQEEQFETAGHSPVLGQRLEIDEGLELVIGFRLAREPVDYVLGVLGLARLVVEDDVVDAEVVLREERCLGIELGLGHGAGGVLALVEHERVAVLAAGLHRIQGDLVRPDPVDEPHDVADV